MGVVAVSSGPIIVELMAMVETKACASGRDNKWDIRGTKERHKRRPAVGVAETWSVEKMGMDTIIGGLSISKSCADRMSVLAGTGRGNWGQAYIQPVRRYSREAHRGSMPTRGASCARPKSGVYAVVKGTGEACHLR